ncbi:hypothetical protein NLJ89_g7583 [Agrocybe chaxingu]|uniref:Uncharacterized protein n=1 Tax=Agrocybe chaxingu TaxID=84603 RepID=A0A9W8JX27_9AGAR|nr:hypothetical protein NLJ89_g7583 [Agrocybe chaxingu]
MLAQTARDAHALALSPGERRTTALIGKASPVPSLVDAHACQTILSSQHPVQLPTLAAHHLVSATHSPPSMGHGQPYLYLRGALPALVIETPYFPFALPSPQCQHSVLDSRVLHGALPPPQRPCLRSFICTFFPPLLRARPFFVSLPSSFFLHFILPVLSSSLLPSLPSFRAPSPRGARTSMLKRSHVFSLLWIL